VVGPGGARFRQGRLTALPTSLLEDEAMVAAERCCWDYSAEGAASTLPLVWPL
jgi:hypothetical protein